MEGAATACDLSQYSGEVRRSRGEDVYAWPIDERWSNEQGISWVEPAGGIFISCLIQCGTWQGDQAQEDIDSVLLFYPDAFDVHLGILRTHLLQGRNGSALLELDKTEALAETDEQKALVYFWGAIVYERRDDSDNAAEYWELLLDLPVA